MKQFFILIPILAIAFNSEAQVKSYLALGDSYTICQSIDSTLRWPIQLANILNEKTTKVETPTIIAKTGWRTDDMLKAAEKEVKEKKYDLVSLLIGVNNEFQGWEPKKFKPEFEKCLDYAIEHCAQGKEGVFVVSIPDYGYTPYGSKNQAKISARLDIYNLICKTITTEKGVDFYDITPISRQDKKDKTLLAKDGLHPSAKQYTLWVNSFADKVYKLTK